MRTEVQTLIAALTTERDSIDRAITALRAMSDAPPTVRATTRTRQWLPVSIKREIVQRMLAAKATGERGAVALEARQCAQDFGCRANTVRQNWMHWHVGDGLDPMAPATHVDYSAELVGSAS